MRRWVALLFLAFGGGACVGGAGARKSVETYPDASVVLISIDTLRADHLSL